MGNYQQEWPSCRNDVGSNEIWAQVDIVETSDRHTAVCLSCLLVTWSTKMHFYTKRKLEIRYTISKTCLHYFYTWHYREIKIQINLQILLPLLTVDTINVVVLILIRYLTFSFFQHWIFTCQLKKILITKLCNALALNTPWWTEGTIYYQKY